MLEELAQDPFEIQEIQIEVGKSPQKRLEGSEALPDLGLKLYPLSFKGRGTTRNIAGLLNSLSAPELGIFCPLTKIIAFDFIFLMICQPKIIEFICAEVRFFFVTIFQLAGSGFFSSFS